MHTRLHLESHHTFLPHRARIRHRCTKSFTPASKSYIFFGKITPPAFFSEQFFNRLFNSSIPDTLQQPHPKHIMTFDMDWSPSFCLACDKQTESVYCSEACRLAEYEVASNVGSAASSPASSRGSVSWPARQSNNGFYLEPAYNFSNAQPYGTTPSPRSSHFYQPSRPKSSPASYSKPVLTPSSSQSSLFSMHSSTSSTSSEPTQLSDESRRALRAYASSFDQSRYSRRQSTN